ncbi:uncharacterized protein LOC116410339 isoform X3 [Xenopus tropicalis]|uniref:Uncharacterized protein LOC116410339 isoform X3 n=1 Tax=Xenopus tropicalis TaxID=8364 RepID=A0A8J1JIH5_XENTR|nr:uncharacterized protein LOC116410339 isoform X3 [Xenopus tropicalis]
MASSSYVLVIMSSFTYTAYQLAYISLLASCVTRLLLFITLFNSHGGRILHSMKLYEEKYRRICKAAGWVSSGLFIGLCEGRQNVTSVLLSINISLFFSNWILPTMIPIIQLVLFRFVLDKYRGFRLRFNPKNVIGEFIVLFFYVLYCAFIGSLSIILIFSMKTALLYYSISSYFYGFMPWHISLQWILLYLFYVAITDTFLFISAINTSEVPLNAEPQECHSSEDSTHSHVKASPANPTTLKLLTPEPNPNVEHLTSAATQSAQPFSDHWLSRIKRGLKIYKTKKNNRHVTKQCKNKIV